MARKNQEPKDPFEVVTTYAEFQVLVENFAAGKYNCLVIIGGPGTGKSENMRRAIEGKRGLYCSGGQLTPLQFYIDCYLHRREPIILDDANMIMATDVGRRLIMSLTDTRPVKTLDWRSSNPSLAKQGVPNSFQTKSRLCYMSNSWLSDSPAAEALEDRAHLIRFEPSAREVHLYTRDWFWDDEILDFIGKHLHLIDRHSCRIYYNASERKKAGQDWEKYILGLCHDTNLRLIQDLQKDPECRTQEDRAKKFMEMTGRSRATYFNHKKKLNKNGQMEPIKPVDLPTRLKTKGKPPPAPEDIELDDDEEVEQDEEDETAA